MKENIFGFNYWTGNENDLDKVLNKAIVNNDKQYIINLNTKFIKKNYNSSRVKNFCNSCDIQLNSASLIKFFSKLKNNKVKWLFSEKQILSKLGEIAKRNKASITICGSGKKIVKIQKYLSTKYPECKIINIDNAKMDYNQQLNKINSAHSSILIIDNYQFCNNYFLTKYKLEINSQLIYVSLSNFQNNVLINFLLSICLILKIMTKKMKSKFTKKSNSKGLVIGWYYPPQITAQAISTFKILKNSKYNYDVFTSRNTYFCYATSNDFDIFQRDNIQTIYSDNLDPTIWCEEGANYFLNHKDEYEFLMTRIMPDWSHDVGLKVKEKVSDIKWVASFADPLFNSPYVLSNIAYDNFPEKEAKKILKNYKKIFKNNNEKYACFNSLIEQKDKIMKVFKLADLLIFTNKYQLQWMLGDDYDKYKNKCFILPHSYDPDFYIKSKNKKNEYKEFLFLGHTDKYRNLNSLIEAVNLLKQEDEEYIEKIRFTLIGNIYDKTLELINNYALQDVFKIEKNVDYFESLDIMNDMDVLIHCDAKFDFMDNLNIYFALSTDKGITHDIIKETHNLFCEIDDIEGIKETIKEIIENKYSKLKHKNYNKYNSHKIMKKYDKIMAKKLKIK